MSGLEPVPVSIVLIGTSIAAVTDIWKFRVYNALTFPLLLSGLVFQAVTGGWAGLGNSCLGALFGFFSLVLFYGMGGVGAGDVKLLAAVGAWLGMPLTFYVFLASSLAAGVYAIGLLLLQGGLTEVYVGFHVLFQKLKTNTLHLQADRRIEREAQRPDRRKRLIPFALMLLVGLIATLFYRP